MPWIAQNALVLTLAGIAACGCYAHRSFEAGGPVIGETGYRFWPPPASTSQWTSAAEVASADESVGDVAKRILRVLEQAHYEHGFALTTRLERIRDDATAEALPERWTALYPDAANLIWLRDPEPRFPRPGRYRVLLLAFTDLPIGGGRPVHWNEETVMAGPDLPPARLPMAQHVPPGYRIVVFIYEYASRAADERGAFVSEDAKLPADTHMRGSGLLALARRSE
jgi:hypothetical protein